MNRTNAGILLVLLASNGYGAVRWANEFGNAFVRTDFSYIQFKLNSSTAQTLVSDGDPVAAIQAALDSWNSIPHTAIHFAPLQITSGSINASDGQNVIAFANTAETRTAVSGFVAITRHTYSPDGRISETDIILNPDLKFSTTQQPNTYDLQSIMAHELGHALGANHATVASATMFSYTLPQNNSKAQLKMDDAAFAVEAYPGPNAAGAYGLITGTARKNGAPVAGASIVAADPNTGAAFGTVSSLTDGSFALRVTPGNYVLFAQPLAGLIGPNTFYNIPGSVNDSPLLPGGKVDSAFQAGVSGGPDAPTSVHVDGGATVAGNPTVAAGASALSITAVGKIVTVNGTSSFLIGTPPVIAQAGQSLDFIVSGVNLDASITEQDVRLIGPGARIVPGTLRVENRVRDLDGRIPLRFTIDIPARSGSASISVFIVHGSDTALVAGAIAVSPVKPMFTVNGLVDAASFKGTGVAPGELVSLFGTGVGPSTPVTNSGFDPATGELPTALGGTIVTFDGIRAPLIFASSGQINLQVPYEIAGRGSTTVVVQDDSASSDPVTVRVLSAQPGIFVALNQDLSVNSTVNAAARGSVVTLYASGAGVVDPPVPSGKPAPSSPLSIAHGVVVRIGGIEARVFFGGLAPGFVGLVQLNVEVPAGSATGSVPAELTIAGQTTQAPTTIAVR